MKPWESEPNECRFDASGLHCAMKRNRMGAWCGYVAVPKDHPLFGKSYRHKVKPPQSLIERPFDIDKIGAINLLRASGDADTLSESCEIVLLFDVHGGLTYAEDHCPLEAPNGEWWFGFDCSHAGDVTPDMDSFDPGAVYRDVEYVKQECRNLARQLSEWPALAGAA